MPKRDKWIVRYSRSMYEEKEDIFWVSSFSNNSNNNLSSISLPSSARPSVQPRDDFWDCLSVCLSLNIVLFSSKKLPPFPPSFQFLLCLFSPLFRQSGAGWKGRILCIGKSWCMLKRRKCRHRLAKLGVWDWVFLVRLGNREIYFSFCLQIEKNQIPNSHDFLFFHSSLMCVYMKLHTRSSCHVCRKTSLWFVKFRTLTFQLVFGHKINY